MAEERPGDESEDRGELERARPAEPSHVESAQPSLDPEQLRQFQQFQQFQDYLKFTEAQKQGGQVVSTQPGGPPTPPPPRGGVVDTPQPPRRPRLPMPRFVKRALASVLSALIFIAVLGIAGKLVYDHYFPAQQDNLPASQTGGGTYHANKILSTEPYEAVRTVYDAIAQNDPNPENMVAKACGRFREDIQQKFGTDMGYPDCRQAVLALHTQVTSVNNYLESIYPKKYDPSAPGVTIDSCDFTINGGPALGVFTVTRVEKGQWLITGHEPGPKTCAPPTTASR